MTQRFDENENKEIFLDNEKVSAKEFNEALESLKKNQRIVESSSGNFHTVERFYD